MKKRIISILSIIIGLAILGGVYTLCHFAMHAVPYEYLKPTATVMLFILLLDRYGESRSNWKKKRSETKEEE